MEVSLLACAFITEKARAELARAGCTIHQDMLWGELENVEIVELHHYGGDDIHIMSVWGVPREIIIPSHNLYLHYQWHISYNGPVLTVLDEDIPEPAPPRAQTEQTEQSELGDMDEHPF